MVEKEKWRGRRSAKRDAAAGRKKEDSVRRVKLKRRRAEREGTLLSPPVLDERELQITQL